MTFFCLSEPLRTLESFMEPLPLLSGQSWFNTRICIASDCCLHPPLRSVQEQVMEDFKLICVEDAFEFIKGLAELAASSPLAKVYEVGGDGDGHRYLYDSIAGGFYVWWHDPDEIEFITQDLRMFLNWMVSQRGRDPAGRTWTTFFQIGEKQPPSKTWAHSEQFSLSRLQLRATTDFGEFQIKHFTDSSLSLLQPDRAFLIESTYERRPYFSCLTLTMSPECRSDLAFGDKGRSFTAWMESVGFCDPDSPNLIHRPESDYTANSIL